MTDDLHIRTSIPFANGSGTGSRIGARLRDAVG